MIKDRLAFAHLMWRQTRFVAVFGVVFAAIVSVLLYQDEPDQGLFPVVLPFVGIGLFTISLLWVTGKVRDQVIRRIREEEQSKH